ncbi:tRNA (adenosine(37)-N6)-threonylcarbamoyltransferase complex transferase subunit TsaD [Corynebacterium terpenotabidum]|uniref:tRNA N6-adenosine threonylcarbamoyltransferase n=1 Tax=Corynebacterium terpenotabidum Y-11 TaxID=1200352 RepID=S4XG04_9CORY|nr:tRNA (adenosine(37)-N6)-threonylcarbamoyltransferase complex transferase subunit TsaD [Corynebacterium terpenotabidum]AGP31504.1 O-sialoglycoprotein endopeptidase [Corynebacterium terpenotabidum Y-11]
MHVLAVDTSTSHVVAGVVEVSSTGALRVLAERTELNPRGHMEVLTPNIVDCLAEAGLTPGNLDAVVVGTGPGPFTGLRVGMATAAAFGEALGVPVHGVESHVATACAGSGSADPTPDTVLVVSDARRREWYWTVVDPTAARIVDGPEVTAPDVPAGQYPQARVLAAREIAATPGQIPKSWDLLATDAHPTPSGLVTAALRRGPLSRPGVPLRALYLRRPDAVEPTRKPVSEALDFHGVDLDSAAGTPVVAKLTEEDAAACAVIEESVFTGDSPWSAAAFRSEITAPHTRYLGLFRDGDLLGFAGLAMAGPVSDPEFEIHTIALTPEAQGRGWSMLLMDPLIELADRHRGPVFLEVRTDNEPAVGLYRRYGFDIIGTRRGYYQPSGADAYTMVRPAAAPAAPTSPASAGSGPQIVLGIESSCDETGVGIVELATGDGHTTVTQISNRVASSMEQHARFGGVVPEIASRAHLESVVPTLQAARADLAAHSGRTRPDAVAATVGPGLAGALLVGAAAAKACAAAWEVPFYGVNHLGGHVAVDTLHTGDPGRDATVPDDLPHAVALLVSGGHTQILEVRGVGRPMVELGSTLDDAAGEAYDKVARLLGLGYPGGPVIDRLAASGDGRAIAFPRGLSKSSDPAYDFSFSGLKTAVARYVEQAARRGEVIPVADLCASFQEAVVDVLTAKAVQACRDTGATVLLLGGGVSANRRLRDLAAARCADAGVTLHVPPLPLCTDNGVMIATLAAHLIAAGAAPSGLRAATDPSMDVETPLLADGAVEG